MVKKLTKKRKKITCIRPTRLFKVQHFILPFQKIHCFELNNQIIQKFVCRIASFDEMNKIGHSTEESCQLLIKILRPIL